MIDLIPLLVMISIVADLPIQFKSTIALSIDWRTGRHRRQESILDFNLRNKTCNINLTRSRFERRNRTDRVVACMFAHAPA